MKLFDEVITWGGLHNNPHSAKVQVQIFEHRTLAGSGGRRKVIILTEPPDNHGTSVTNGVEQIASRVLRDHAIDFSSATFVEHYPDSTIRGRSQSEATFDLVYLQQNDRGDCVKPDWAPTDWETVAKLIGMEGKQWDEV